MIAGSPEDLQGRKTLRQPVRRENDWAIYDNSGWLRGTARTRERGRQLIRDFKSHHIGTPILDPPHYD